jgi:hypothetical protein
MEHYNSIESLRGKIFTAAKDRSVKVIGTYFYGMLSSGVWQPNSDGVYVIDRPSEGFDRILQCQSTGKLSCKGLTDYLDYFLIPFTRIWDYSKAFLIEGLDLRMFLQLEDKRLCGSTNRNSMCIYDTNANMIESNMKGHSY